MRWLEQGVLTRVVALRGGAVESEHRVAWCVTRPGRSGRAAPTRTCRSSRAPRSSRCRRSGSVRAGVARALRARHAPPRDRVRVARRLAGPRRGGRRGARGLRPASRARSAAGRSCRATRATAEGVRPSRIRHNCSGKHAFGLARCLAEGWPLDGYFRAGHPLQGAMRDCVAEACGVSRAERGGDRRLRDADVRRPARRARPRVRRASPAAGSGRPATAARGRCAPTRSSSPTRARSTPS